MVDQGKTVDFNLIKRTGLVRTFIKVMDYSVRIKMVKQVWRKGCNRKRDDKYINYIQKNESHI